MNRIRVNIIMLLIGAFALSACGTTSSQNLAPDSAKPILSAAEAKSMIHVEVRALQPLGERQTLVSRVD